MKKLGCLKSQLSLDCRSSNSRRYRSAVIDVTLAGNLLFPLLFAR